MSATSIRTVGLSLELWAADSTDHVACWEHKEFCKIQHTQIQTSTFLYVTSNFKLILIHFNPSSVEVYYVVSSHWLLIFI